MEDCAVNLSSLSLWSVSHVTDDRIVQYGILVKPEMLKKDFNFPFPLHVPLLALNEKKYEISHFFLVFASEVQYVFSCC